MCSREIIGSGSIYRNSSKVSVVFGIFSLFFFFCSVKINISHPLFTFMPKIHVRSDNQCKTGAVMGKGAGRGDSFMSDADEGNATQYTKRQSCLKHCD